MKRKLYQNEIDLLKKIFKDKINYQKIKIFRGGILSYKASRTFGFRIFLQKKHFNNDSDSIKDESFNVLVHEVTHVWQFERRGYEYLWNSLLKQLLCFIKYNDRRRAYYYADSIRKKTFVNLDSEEQARLVQDYYIFAYEQRYEENPIFNEKKMRKYVQL